MALYDALQKRLSKATTPLLAEAGKTDVGTQTAAIQSASTGKAAAPVAAVPSLAEQSAAAGATTDISQAAAQSSLQAQALGMAEQQNTAQTQLGNQQLDEQMRQGQQQLAGQAYNQRETLASGERLSMQRLQSDEERKSDTIAANAEQVVANLLSNRKLSENDIFASFAQDGRELEFRRDQAAIEQMGTVLALRDRAYVDELSRVGKQRNLDDQQAFEKESTRLILGEQTASYLDKLEWTQADLLDNLRFAEKMSSMDINQAWALMKMASDNANASMVATGVTSAASAGAQYAASKPAAPVTASSAEANTINYDASIGGA